MSASSDLHEEHRAVLLMMRILGGAEASLRRGEELAAADLTAMVDFLRGFVDRCHHLKEEQVLFPIMWDGGDERTRALLERLLADHTLGREYVRALALATQAEAHPATLRPEEAMHRYRALLGPHIQIEEMEIFPLADRVLAAETQTHIEREYERIEREEVGPGRHEAFHALLHQLSQRYVSTGEEAVTP